MQMSMMVRWWSDERESGTFDLRPRVLRSLCFGAERRFERLDVCVMLGLCEGARGECLGIRCDSVVLLHSDEVCVALRVLID